MTSVGGDWMEVKLEKRDSKKDGGEERAQRLDGFDHQIDGNGSVGGVVDGLGDLDEGDDADDEGGRFWE